MTSVEFATGKSVPLETIAQVFRDAFTSSEGKTEGELIAQLAHNLMKDTASNDLRVYVAQSESDVIACVMFSRLDYRQDLRNIWLLSPLAVLTAHQNQSVGSGLIRYALSCLLQEGVDAVFIYGDPNFYQRVGFVYVDQTVAKAPFDLSMPEGWLVVSLSSQAFSPIQGESQCVQALRDSKYW